MHYTKWLLPSFVLVSSFSVAEDLFDLSLMELGQLPVSVASMGEKTLVTAPASVSVYDAKDIANLGRYSLADLAEVTPGFSSYYIYGEKVLQTRGQKAGSFENNKHLLLLDGIPINHARANKAGIEHELPLFMANSVQWMRGPDSTLHGSGAFFGVIEVETAHTSTGLVRVLGEGQQVSFSQVSNQQALYASQYLSPDSGEPVGPAFSDLQRLRDHQNSQFFYGNVRPQTSAKDWQFGFIYLSKRSGLGEHWMGDFSTQANDITWTTAIPFVKYQLKRGGGEWNVKAWMNRGTETGYWAPFTATSFVDATGQGGVFNAYDVVVLKRAVNVSWQGPIAMFDWQFGAHGETTNNVSGDSYLLNVMADDVNDGDPSTTPYEYSAVDNEPIHGYSAFFNGETARGAHNFSFGGRLDLGHFKRDEYEHFSPKISWVWSLSPSSAIKASYRSALRAPGIKEYSLNDEAKSNLSVYGVTGSLISDLRPETFRNVELNWVKGSQAQYWQINVFYNETHDALDGGQLQVTDNNNVQRVVNRFENREGVIYANGMELESQWRMSSALMVRTNLSYAQSEYQGSALFDVPDWSANAWFTYESGLWTLSSLYHYQHAYQNGEQKKGAGIQTWDATLAYRLGAGISAYSDVRNLLDRQQYLSQSGEDRIPLPDRQWGIRLTWTL